MCFQVTRRLAAPTANVLTPYRAASACFGLAARADGPNIILGEFGTVVGRAPDALAISCVNDVALHRHPGPFFKVLDVANGRHSQSVTSCDFAVGARICADRVNVGFRDLRLRHPPASGIPPFCNAIVDIVLSSPHEEVLGLNASTIVAGMTDVQPIRGVAMNEGVGIPMSEDFSTLLPLANSEVPVSFVLDWALPL